MIHFAFNFLLICKLVASAEQITLNPEYKETLDDQIICVKNYAPPFYTDSEMLNWKYYKLYKIEAFLI